MSTNTDAILAYGYDLGDTPSFVGEDDPDWWSEDSAFFDAAERRLLDASGFTERYADGRPGYHGREGAALEALGVKLETHCSDGAPMYLLAAAGTVTTACRGYPEVIGALVVPSSAPERLAWAVEILGLDLGGAEPAWLLASYWGRDAPY